MSVQTLLNQEINSQFDDLKGLQVGSKEHATAVEGLAKLVDKAIEMERFEMTHDEDVKAREKELELKEMQMKEEKKDRFIKNLLTGASILIPTMVTIWGTKASFEFEKEGTITTIMGRGFINKLLPKK